MSCTVLYWATQQHTAVANSTVRPLPAKLYGKTPLWIDMPARFLRLIPAGRVQLLHCCCLPAPLLLHHPPGGCCHHLQWLLLLLALLLVLLLVVLAWV
jgi:hypothetical protein